MIRPFMDPGTVAKILATWVHERDTPEFLYGKHNPKEVPNDSRHWKKQNSFGMLEMSKYVMRVGTF